ncbi:uncharacterized protein [Drosophila takahashii]|uniref:uncharacterized protein n=1 Tax=Drosophila takahashii TaxID=29030 RepID=UPI003898E68F
MIINVVTGVHKGTIDPALLSVNQLRRESINIQAHLPNGQRLPVKQETIHDVYRLITTQVQELDELLVFHSKVPLVDEDPLLRQATLGPAHELLRCTLAAFHKEHDPLCALTLPNSWIFATAKEITLTYVCGEERHQVHIGGSGNITLNENCIARSATLTLQGHPHLQSAIHEQEPAIFVHPMSLLNKPEVIMEHDMGSRYGNHTQQLTQLQEEVQTLKKMQTQQPNESMDDIQRSSHVVAREIIQQGSRFPEGEGARDSHNMNYHTATNVERHGDINY